MTGINSGGPASEQSSGVIVVIEDDPNISDALSLMLKEHGYRVISVQDGEKAVEAAQLYRPDLITLDLMLPGKDGFTVARELLDDARTANIPLVILSAYTDDVDEPIWRRVTAIITKPFNVDEVTSEIDAILRQRRDTTT
jgi:DNA-binding response OmpR family regulator